MIFMTLPQNLVISNNIQNILLRIKEIKFNSQLSLESVLNFIIAAIDDFNLSR